MSAHDGWITDRGNEERQNVHTRKSVTILYSFSFDVQQRKVKGKILKHFLPVC